MSRALIKGFLAGLIALGAVISSAPFIIRLAVRVMRHAKIMPHLVAPDVNLAFPWALGLAGAFLALGLAAFLIAFDVGSGSFRRSFRPPNARRIRTRH